MAGGRSTPVCVLPSWMCCFALCVLFPSPQHMEQHTLKRIRKWAQSLKSNVHMAKMVVVHVCANVRLTISMSYHNKVKTSQSFDLKCQNLWMKYTGHGGDVAPTGRSFIRATWSPSL